MATTRQALRQVATVTATTTTELKIKPTVRQKLLNELRAFAELKVQADALYAAMDKHKAKVRELREGTGYAKLELEGFKITDVQGRQSKLNTDQMLKDGLITAGDIANYTVTTPKKAYEKITLPNEVETAY